MPIFRVSILTSALLLALLFAVQPMLSNSEGDAAAQSVSTTSILREMANRGSRPATMAGWATPSSAVQR